MGLLLQVNQPNGLVLVQRQQDRLGIPAPVGAEGIDLWCATNPSAPWRVNGSPSGASRHLPRRGRRGGTDSHTSVHPKGTCFAASTGSE